MEELGMVPGSQYDLHSLTHALYLLFLLLFLIIVFSFSEECLTS